MIKLPVCTSVCIVCISDDSLGQTPRSASCFLTTVLTPVSSDLPSPEVMTANLWEPSVLGASLLAVKVQPLFYE